MCSAAVNRVPGSRSVAGWKRITSRLDFRSTTPNQVPQGGVATGVGGTAGGTQLPVLPISATVFGVALIGLGLTRKPRLTD